jgi:hypothetical protein
MIAEPVKKDFKVPQGATYPIEMRYIDANSDPIDLTGATVVARLKNQYYEADADLECTIANGKAYLTPTTWYFGFTLLPADTLALEATVYYYDLTVTKSDGDVTRAMEGQITLTPAV